MDEAILKKERRGFEKRVFLTSLALSVPLSLAFLTRSAGDALAFFLSQLVVAADVVLLSELSGSMLEKGRGTGPRIAAALMLVVGEGTFATAGAVALGVLGLTSVAISRRGG